MPDDEFPKFKPHPFRESGRDPLDASVASALTAATGSLHPPYAELCVTSNYTFLTGASHPEEFVGQAALLGYRAIAVTDTNTIAGVVRAHVAAKESGLQFILGTRLRLMDLTGCSVFAYPTDMDAYRRLCRLLTTGKRRAPKGECHLTVDDLSRFAEGLLAIVAPGAEITDDLPGQVQSLKVLFNDDRLSIAASVGYGPDDGRRLERLEAISNRAGVPLVATNDAAYHTADRRMLHDVVSCIRHGCTLEQAGFRLDANGERYLKPPEEMGRLFAELPRAVTRTLEIADRVKGFGLDQLKYEYPDEIVPAGKTAQEHLKDLVDEGAAWRYPRGVPGKMRDLIRHELELIDELKYAPYFLTVRDLVRFARTGEERPGEAPSKTWAGEILCQGRGAAANSAVCYCLRVTEVDPSERGLLFERFVSRERNEPPDIDIDFEHHRREEVIQYIYRKYGRDRAALTAEVITYRRRSAVRDVGKSLGLSLDAVDRLAKDIEWFDSGVANPQRLRELGLNPDDPVMRWFVRLVTELLGFPRHLSQHVGGFVITRSPLDELVPVENAAMPERTVVEWDKDDIDAVGMLKVDVLGLGMLSVLRRCFELVNTRRKREGAGSMPRSLDPSTPLGIPSVPHDDKPTYAMIQKADTVGVFQIESRAQMSMLPRLKPSTFYDLVIEVAIVRPGPIQGGMVHPYLRRRRGLEKPEQLPDEVPEKVRREVNEVLDKTLGVPLFQEQCMALAVRAAGFTPGRADQLRRAMAAWKRKGDQMFRFGQELIEGMKNNNIPEDFAKRCFDQIKGFSEYGFPESHAASFAILVYASAWLKCHYPAEFCAALLNSQPMGFYPPAQLVRDAKEHGVTILPVDVAHSDWETTVDAHSSKGSVRLGMQLVNGVGEPDALRLRQAVVARGPFRSMLALWRASGVKTKTLRRLAAADAFNSMGLSRQQALWQARLLRDDPLPLFDAQPEPAGAPGAAGAGDGLDRLPAIAPLHQVVLDYHATGLSLKAHPVSFARDKLRELGAVPCDDLKNPARTPEGELITVAGLVLVRQRPGTAKDVTFITLEDETGIANLVIWLRVYQKYRRAASSRLVVATGKVQRQGEVVHLTVTAMRAFDEAIEDLTVPSRNFH